MLMSMVFQVLQSSVRIPFVQIFDLFHLHAKCLYVLELTVGFESNLSKNIIRKREKYKNLIKDLKSDYSSVKFINLSMSSLGVLSAECSTFQDMLNDIGIDEKQQRYIIRKMINFALELLITYFRNKNWDNPELLKC